MVRLHYELSVPVTPSHVEELRISYGPEWAAVEATSMSPGCPAVDGLAAWLGENNLVMPVAKSVIETVCYTRRRLIREVRLRGKIFEVNFDGEADPVAIMSAYQEMCAAAQRRRVEVTPIETSAIVSAVLDGCVGGWVLRHYRLDVMDEAGHDPAEGPWLQLMPLSREGDQRAIHGRLATMVRDLKHSPLQALAA